MIEKKQKVIIIGAGPAGLTAGLELLRHGQEVLILEEDPTYVGGISRTVNYKGYRFDIGGHRFFSKNQEVMQWWHAILGNDFLQRPRSSRWFYKKKFFSYPIKPFEISWKFGPVFALRFVGSYTYRRFFPIKPVTNMKAWFQNNFGDFLAKPFFIDYNEKLWGIPCDQLATDFATQRIKGVSVWNTLIDPLKKKFSSGSGVKSFIDTFNYPKLGPGQMWEKVAKVIREKGGTIQLGNKVTDIHIVHGRVEYVEVLRNGVKEQIRGDQFVSTMPFRELAIQIAPPLSNGVLEAAQKLKMRDFITVGIIVNEPNICPDNWIYTHDEGMKPIRFQNYKNWSPFMVPDSSKTVIGLEYTCNAITSDLLWGMTDEELKKQGISDFLRLGFVTRDKILDASVIRMKNVYPVYDLEYQEKISRIRAEVDSISNLHPIGRGGIHKYNNSDHSMVTAFLAVKNIMAGERKYDVFNVNSDAEYHEEEQKKWPYNIPRF
ncbi:MAG: NAD(P)/FAD-dependent oxidoreductase [Candidatus Paceibacterota bacterium]|jgi:protoporphyrinogen oxidase